MRNQSNKLIMMMRKADKSWKSCRWDRLQIANCQFAVLNDDDADDADDADDTDDADDDDYDYDEHDHDHDHENDDYYNCTE